jgi:hypothetical protein
MASLLFDLINRSVCNFQSSFYIIIFIFSAQLEQVQTQNHWFQYVYFIIILESDSLQPASIYTFERLEEIVSQKKKDSIVLLDRMRLNCEDMRAVAYYLFKDNNVKLFIYSKFIFLFYTDN